MGPIQAAAKPAMVLGTQPVEVSLSERYTPIHRLDLCLKSRPVYPSACQVNIATLNLSARQMNFKDGGKAAAALHYLQTIPPESALRQVHS